MFAEMLVTEFVAETLDVALLHGAPWLDQDVAHQLKDLITYQVRYVVFAACEANVYAENIFTTFN